MMRPEPARLVPPGAQTSFRPSLGGTPREWPQGQGPLCAKRARPRRFAPRSARLGDRASEEGIALVEFALMLPILLMLLVGIFDLSLAVWQSNTLTTAVREGTRLAIVSGSTSASPIGSGNDSALVQRVRDAAVGLRDVTVSTSWPDGSNARGQRVSVTATAQYTPVLSQAFLGGALRVTLSAASDLVIHR